jgi:hypothetical protein
MWVFQLYIDPIAVYIGTGISAGQKNGMSWFMAEMFQDSA